MLKKTLPLSLAATLMLSTSLSAFAAEATPETGTPAKTIAFAAADFEFEDTLHSIIPIVEVDFDDDEDEDDEDEDIADADDEDEDEDGEDDIVDADDEDGEDDIVDADDEDGEDEEEDIAEEEVEADPYDLSGVVDATRDATMISSVEFTHTDDDC